MSAINAMREIQVNFLKDNMFSIRVRILAPPKADANTVAPCLHSNNAEAYSLDRWAPSFKRTRSSQDNSGSQNAVCRRRCDLFRKKNIVSQVLGILFINLTSIISRPVKAAVILILNIQ